MSFSAPPPTRLVAASRRATANVSALVACSAGLLRVLFVLARSPLLVPLALRAPRQLERLGRVALATPQLCAVSPGIWRVTNSGSRAEPRASTSGSRAEPRASTQPTGPTRMHAPAAVVLHFTGTGESVHAAYENTRHLFEREPRLASATHFLFEAPHSKGAYYGPEAFSAAMWQQVAPLVAHYDGPFVLVGVSRGALVALDHAIRIVEECGKPASVLALSAPLAIPRRIPPVIRAIAGFESMLGRLELSLPKVSGGLSRFLHACVRRSYVVLTALVLRHHDVYDVRNLERNALDLRDHGVLAACLRASREFRLLVRSGPRELQLFAQLLAGVLTRHRERLFVALVWGAQDAWMDAESCRRNIGHVDGLATEVLADQGHLLCARDAERHQTYQRWLERVVDQAERGARSSRRENARTCALRDELHLPTNVRRQHD